MAVFGPDGKLVSDRKGGRPVLLDSKGRKYGEPQCGVVLDRQGKPIVKNVIEASAEDALRELRFLMEVEGEVKVPLTGEELDILDRLKYFDGTQEQLFRLAERIRLTPAFKSRSSHGGSIGWHSGREGKPRMKSAPELHAEFRGMIVAHREAVKEESKSAFEELRAKMRAGERRIVFPWEK